MYFHVVVMKKSDFTTYDYRKVDLIQKVADYDVHIREVDLSQPDGYASHNFNPEYFYIYMLGTV